MNELAARRVLDTGRRTYRWWASVVVAAVAGFVRNYRKEERSLSGEHRLVVLCRESR